MDKIAEYGAIAEALVGYVEHGSTDLANGVLTVPVESYTDPARFAREIDMIFKHLPLMAALTIEMPKPGDYKAMNLVGTEILVTRGQDGAARAFFNVCQHRGAPVAAAGRGNCKRFSCPYHGWTYGNDGRLIGVSDAAKFGEIDRTTHGLSPLPCVERAGMIFVCLTPGQTIDIEHFLGGMLDDLEQLGLHRYHYCGSREITGANWKVAYDGYLEGYHFATLHPNTIHPRTFNNIMHFDAFGPHLRVGYPQTSIRKLLERPRSDWWSHENDGFDFVRTLFPNVSIFLAPEIGQIAQLIPGPTVDRNRTVLHFVSAKPPETEEDGARLDHMMDFLRDVVNDEDYAMGNDIQRSLASGGLRVVTFGRNERGNQIFHKWVEYYLNGAKGAAPADR